MDDEGYRHTFRDQRKTYRDALRTQSADEIPPAGGDPDEAAIIRPYREEPADG